MMPEGNDPPTGSGAPTDQPPGAPATPNPASGANQPPAPGATDPVSNPEAKKYADEAASERKARKALEAELKKFQDAQLSAEQKRERDFGELQAKTLDQELRLQRQALEIAGYRLAPKLGIANPGLALAAVQSEHAEAVTYDEKTGAPTNLEALFKQVLKDYPELAGPQRPPANSGGPANPGRQAGNGGLTREMIEAMSNQERKVRWSEIDAWRKANPDAVRAWAQEPQQP